MEKGESCNITATVKPDDAYNKDVTWSISGTGATISSSTTSKATITGVTEFSKLTLTATAKDGSGKSASCIISVPKIFSYTGNIQSYTLPSGQYIVEAWGGSGGQGAKYFSYSPDSSDVNTDRNGSYENTALRLDTARTVYVCVGGKGNGPSSATDTSCSVAGGYNGGGNGYKSSYNGSYGMSGGGGGATHVAFKSGLLKNVSSNDDLIVVAGSGGGHTVNDSGYYSEDGTNTGASGGSGTLTSGGLEGVPTDPGTRDGYINILGRYSGTNGSKGQGGNGAYSSGKFTYNNSSFPSHGGGGGGGGLYGGGAEASIQWGKGSNSRYLHTNERSWRLWLKFQKRT